MRSPAKLKFILIALALGLSACGTLQFGVEPPTPTPTALMTADVNARVIGTATALKLTALAEAATSTPPSLGFTATPVSTLTSATETPTLIPTQQPATTRPPSAPTATLPSTEPPSATSAPIILSFGVSPALVNPGEAITFTWSANDGLTATISHFMPNQLMGLGWADLSGSGALTVTTDTGWRNTHQFQLTVFGSNGASTSSDWLQVRFHCPDPYYFSSDPDPEPCPNGPAQTISIIQQDFEGGHMLWIPSEVGGHYIYVLYADGSMWSTTDTGTSAEPESDPTLTPPEGKYQPVRGFGKAWRENSFVREKLGWALNLEQSHTTPYQRETGTDWKGWTEYLNLADGRVVRMRGHYVFYGWEYVTP